MDYSGGSRNWEEFARIYTHHSWHLYALEGSGGHPPPENFKIWGLKRRILDHISAEIWSFFGFWDSERGARAGCAPLWIRHWTTLDLGPKQHAYIFIDPKSRMSKRNEAIFLVLPDAGPTLANINPALGECMCLLGGLVFLAAYCWPRLGLQADTDPMSVKCWANVVVLASIHSVLVSTSFCRTCMLAVWYSHDALNQSWVNVDSPFVTLGHIQLCAKHDTVTKYWANVATAL